MSVDGNIFNRLLTLPLFQGMSRTDLQEAVAHTRIGFERYERGEVMASRGDHCTHQLFLVSGQMEVSAVSDDQDYTLTESAEGPFLIQPERLFGLTQRYTRTFTAQTACQMIIIGKSEMIRLASKFEIFRINLFNILTTQAQRAADEPWKPHIEELGRKIMHFILSRCIVPTGEKRLHITMAALASHIGESRLNVSRQLHRWEQEGLVRLSRNQITFQLEH